MSNIFSGRLQSGFVVSHDTLSYINLAALEVNAAWWNGVTGRLEIPAGFDVIEVQAAGFWEYSLAGSVRRIVVQSQSLLTERADNRPPVANEVFLTSCQVGGVIYNPGSGPVSLSLGFYHDAGVPLRVFEAALFVRGSVG